jgi:hypothetical protein
MTKDLKLKGKAWPAMNPGKIAGKRGTTRKLPAPEFSVTPVAECGRGRHAQAPQVADPQVAGQTVRAHNDGTPGPGRRFPRVREA